ncbi:hypothetical protein BC835DRAFT_1418030 [Cytidiella melzeri]|nr:hypothetical protein BC835DRAFT_1418030 [Cytidiella melzeri]
MVSLLKAVDNALPADSPAAKQKVPKLSAKENKKKNPGKTKVEKRKAEIPKVPMNTRVSQPGSGEQATSDVVLLAPQAGQAATPQPAPASCVAPQIVISVMGQIEKVDATSPDTRLAAEPASKDHTLRGAELGNHPEPELESAVPGVQEPAADEETDPSASTWAAFAARRPQLLQEVITHSVVTGSFNDIEIYAYTKRCDASGAVHTPVVVHATTSFLEASSPVLRDLCRSGKRQPRLIPSATWDYEYSDDSDVEDEDEDVPCQIEGTFSPFDDFDDKPPAEVIYAPYGAAKTWQALILYLFDGSVLFRPLKSSPPSCSEPFKDRLSCSPKSMHRLATKLQLTALANLSEDAIIANLCSDNIVHEIFSDFTWRFPDVLDREVAFFRQHCQERHVREDLEKAFKTRGKSRRPEIVLTALFDSLLPAVL